MLLNDGELNGVRILSKASVDLMSRNHLGIIDQTGFFDLDGLGFGLTVGVVEDAGLAGLIGSDGEFFWGGAASTVFWIDPKEDLITIFLTQLVPSSAYNIRRELRTLVYSSINN